MSEILAGLKGGLSNDAIAALMAKSRNRGVYGIRLTEFVESDEAAVDVAETWMEFAGKDATTLYQGFRNAVQKAKLDEKILVKNSDGKCFLLNMERVAVVMGTSVAEVAEESDDSDSEVNPEDEVIPADTVEV